MPASAAETQGHHHHTGESLFCPPASLALFAVAIGRATRTHREACNLFQNTVELAELSRKTEHLLVGPANTMLVLVPRLAAILH